MNTSENFCTWLALMSVAVVAATAMPYGGATMQLDTLSDRTIGWMDFLSPYFTPTTENRKACMYKANTYEDGSLVVTEEPCLKCRCIRGTLVCYLRVCPILPDPPPSNCVLLLRHGACCTELICEDGSINTNHISRSESGFDISSNTTAYRDGCLSNGTIYASGSAMWTNRPCEYCYCIGGKERCVKPRCLPPPDSCLPQRTPHSCCPIRYECEKDLISITSTSSTTHSVASKERGCTVDGVIYPEGDKVTSVAKSPCDNCFCMRGMVRCVPLSCAPPLLGCTPIIHPGECCANSYNCTKQISINHIRNELLPIFENKKVQDEEGTIVNERSFPDDTPLTPSQIADILLGGDGRNYRRIEGKKNTTNEESNVGTTLSTTIVDFDNGTELSNNSLTTQKVDHTTVISEDLENILSLMMNISSNYINQNNDANVNNDSVNEINDHNVTNTVVLNDTLIHVNNDKNNSITTDNSKTIINDTINCTTEISSIEGNLTDNFEKIEKTLNSSETYSDTQERISSVTISEDNFIDSKEVEKNNTDNVSEKAISDLFNIESKYPSTSLIIPKDDDIIMVNVSTYVRTNTSVVTLRPVAAIPPEIEALLNISMKKNNQKDDYYDYDYKSSLPPSLPNLEIIPFLAIDAVLKSDEMERLKNKEIDHFATSYPPVDDEQEYIKSFPPISREKHNSTPYPYITSDTYNPTTFSPYSDEKYLGNPTVFPSLSLRNFNRNSLLYNKLHKQHIDDKFQATTYKTILNDKYDDIQYGIDKYDATVYPSITLDDSQTENPVFRYEGQTHNLFSPPIETEGGFLPRDPPLMNSYFNLGYPNQDDIANPVTDSPLLNSDSLKTNIDSCISNGKEYKNGQLINEPNSCIVCFCYYGDIHCQDPECPPIKPGCRRIMEKGVNSCCGIEICNELKENISTLSNSLDKNINNHELSERIDTNIKDVIQTEAPMKPQSITIDTLPIYSKISRPSSTQTEPPSTMKIEYISSTTKQYPIVTSSTMAHEIQLNETKIINETKIGSTISDSIDDFLSSFTRNDTDSESEIIEDEPEPEEDDSGFSFDAVLKLLLGDTSDTTVKTTIRTTTKYTTPATTPPTTRIQTIHKMTENNPTITIKPTTSRVITTTPSPLYRNTQKYSYSKPNRTSNPVSLIHKNYTKPVRTTTRVPFIYSNINRQTKPKYVYTSTTPQPVTTQTTKKVPFSPLPLVTEQIKSSSHKKSSTTSLNASLPFGAGLLKLAGCNIYGRMYRVGRIISELSGPCLECMCTEIGVQCTPLTC